MYICELLNHKIIIKKFIIKRVMTGVSGAPKHELDKAGKASEAALIEMRAEGKEIRKNKVM